MSTEGLLRHYVAIKARKASFAKLLPAMDQAKKKTTLLWPEQFTIIFLPQEQFYKISK
jgi:hypothetical protein